MKKLVQIMGNDGSENKKIKHKTYGNCLPISRECGCGGPNNRSLNQLFQ